jgi:hypothetical protein
MVHINFPLDIMKETEKDGLVPKRGGREGMERRKTVLREWEKGTKDGRGGEGKKRKRMKVKEKDRESDRKRKTEIEEDRNRKTEKDIDKIRTDRGTQKE